MKSKIAGLQASYPTYERCKYTQVNKYFDPTLSKYQFGLRKGYSARQCLLTLTQKWRASLDQNGTCAGFLIDLSKAIDYQQHDLLIAKLHTVDVL